MKHKAVATFRSLKWDETPFAQGVDLPKLTRADCTQTYSGDIEGESTLTYLMVSLASGATSFLGLERVVGRLGDRSGSFVLRHEGLFQEGVAKMILSVVEGSGTGKLEGLRGSAKFESPHATEYTFELEYDFANE